jgi:hypothetical protein
MIASASRYLTPPQLAERYGVDPNKVLGWIRRGELAAVNVATTTGGRPRWRVSPEALAAFEAARAAGPAPHITRIRRRKDPNVIEYF